MKEHLRVMRDPQRRGGSSSIQADRFDHLLGIFITTSGSMRCGVDCEGFRGLLGELMLGLLWVCC